MSGSAGLVGWLVGSQAVVEDVRLWQAGGSNCWAASRTVDHLDHLGMIDTSTPQLSVDSAAQGSR